MRDLPEKGIGAGVSIVAHVAFFAIILTLPGLDFAVRPQPVPTVLIDLLPEPEPIPPEPPKEPRTKPPAPLDAVRVMRAPIETMSAPRAEVPVPFAEPIAPVKPIEPAPRQDRPAVPAAKKAKTSTSINADWIVKPSAKDMNAQFPSVARRHKVSGRVVLACLIDSENRARNCRILQETPRQYDFGVAAIEAARTFQIRAPVLDGRARHDVWVRIPIAFDFTG